MKQSFICVFICLAAIVLQVRVGFCEDGYPNMQLGSMLEALQINNSAVRQGDVLIWTSTFHDKWEAGHIIKKTVHRLVFDLDSRKAALFLIGRTEVLDENIKNGERTGDLEWKEAKVISFGVVAEGTKAQGYFPGRVDRRRVSSFTEGLVEAEIATPHFFGVAPMELAVPRINKHPLEIADQYWGLWRANWHHGRLSKNPTGSGFVAIFNPPQASGNSVNTETRIYFDAVSMLPTRKTIHWQKDPEPQILRQESFDWVNRDGIYLPEKSSTSSLGSEVFGPDLEKVDTECETVHTFSWLSVNEAIDDELTDPLKNFSVEEISNLVDPKRLGVDDDAPWQLAD